MGLGAPEIVIIAVVAILLFGATKLPIFAKSLGESLRIFKKELKTTDERPEQRSQATTPELPPVLADRADSADRAPEPIPRTESR